MDSRGGDTSQGEDCVGHQQSAVSVIRHEQRLVGAELGGAVRDAIRDDEGSHPFRFRPLGHEVR